MSLQKYLRGRRAANLAEGIEAAIRDGALRPGALLPTVRALAGELARQPDDGRLRVPRPAAARPPGRRRSARHARQPRAAAAASRRAFAHPQRVRDLASGNPDPALLPRLGPALARVARREGPPHLYDDPAHRPELLELARERFAADELRCDALSVVSGALDGVERVLLARLRPGDRVAVEDPGFGGVLHLVRALGMTLLPVAVDDEGPLPDALERRPRARRRGASW